MCSGEVVREGVDRRPVGHVQERCLGPAAGRPDGTGHRLGPISVAPDDPYLGAEAPQGHAAARPMPDEAPVTTTTCPSRRGGSGQGCVARRAIKPTRLKLPTIVASSSLSSALANGPGWGSPAPRSAWVSARRVGAVSGGVNTRASLVIN